MCSSGYFQRGSATENLVPCPVKRRWHFFSLLLESPFARLVQDSVWNLLLRVFQNGDCRIKTPNHQMARAKSKYTSGVMPFRPMHASRQYTIFQSCSPVAYQLQASLSATPPIPFSMLLVCGTRRCGPRKSLGLSFYLLVVQLADRLAACCRDCPMPGRHSSTLRTPEMSLQPHSNVPFQGPRTSKMRSPRFMMSCLKIIREFAPLKARGNSTQVLCRGRDPAEAEVSRSTP